VQERVLGTAKQNDPGEIPNEHNSERKNRQNFRFL